MNELGRFEGYHLRDIEPRDTAQLERWIAADSAHAGLLDADFFMGADPRAVALVLSDKYADLMYVRLTRASRVHIQFRPEPEDKGARELHRHRQQMRNALMKGMAYLEVGLERAGCTEWIFESQARHLRELAQKRMGFVPSPNEMVRFIPRIGREA